MDGNSDAASALAPAAAACGRVPAFLAGVTRATWSACSVSQSVRQQYLRWFCKYNEVQWPGLFVLYVRAGDTFREDDWKMYMTT